VVRETFAERGALVRAGDPILQVDDRILRSQVDEAAARATLARETWERRRRLFEDDRVGSELAYLEARYQAEQAEAALVSLRERLDRTRVRAPISGILEARPVEVGTMVGVGTPVGRIVQVDPIKILAGVPERFAGFVDNSTRATVTFEALGPEVYSANVRYVGATVNASNRTFEVELVIPNRDRTIKPEMVANVRVVLREREGALVIPQEAVVRVEDGFVTFVARDEGGEIVAELRPVRVGAPQRNEVVVEAGLSVGDRLIVLGQNQVAHGDRVRIVNTREPVVPGDGS
jgi:RND family efflux transporter MFP subunit